MNKDTTRDDGKEYIDLNIFQSYNYWIKLPVLTDENTLVYYHVLLGNYDDAYDLCQALDPDVNVTLKFADASNGYPCLSS